MLPSIVLTVVAVAVLLWAEAREHAPLRRLAKPIASAGFIMAGLAAGGMQDAYGRLVMVALALSFVGDVCLLSKRSRWFLAGLVSFLLAHGAYGVAFVCKGLATTWVLLAALPLVAVALAVRRWLVPYVPSGMRRPVDAYMLVITAMVVLAIGAPAAGATGMVALGAIAFYASDLAVARERFVRRTLTNKLWGLPLYYGAQLLLAATIGH